MLSQLSEDDDESDDELEHWQDRSDHDYEPLNSQEYPTAIFNGPNSPSDEVNPRSLPKTRTENTLSS